MPTKSNALVIDFDLPEHLIATHPSERRDHCKMLVVDRSTGKIHHSFFNQLSSFLDDHYFLVLNQARVNPSRMFWTDSKGKKQEILFLVHKGDLTNASKWEAIVSGKNLKTNQPYAIESDLEFMLIKDRENSLAHVQVNKTRSQLETILAKKGQLPLPPYILKKRNDEGIADYSPMDEKNYQTIFAKNAGAVAAPTAGLHFTDETFESLKKKNIGWNFVHLSVGWGTFQPLTQKHFDEKKLHPEYCSISSATASNVLSAKQSGKKALCVGTTVTRTLETWAQKGQSKDGFEGETELFIIPPYNFQISDAMLTNFHIPKSSLLLLVAAFLGKGGEKRIVNIYNEAIKKDYQFYSYGDCMLII